MLLKSIFKLNKEAMGFLRNQNLDSAFKCLKSAEAGLKESGVAPSNRLWGITHNNWGCYYKKLGKLIIALHYYESALKMEVRSVGDAVNLAGVYLNICSIKSQLSEHAEAITYAHRSLDLLDPYMNEDITVIYSIALAYHNLGIEHHLLGKNQEAIRYIQHGLSIAEKHLDVHPVLEMLREDLFNLARPVAVPRTPRDSSPSRHKSAKRTKRKLVKDARGNRKKKLRSRKASPLKFGELENDIILNEKKADDVLDDIQIFDHANDFMVFRSSKADFNSPRDGYKQMINNASSQESFNYKQNLNERARSDKKLTAKKHRNLAPAVSLKKYSPRIVKTRTENDQNLPEKPKMNFKLFDPKVYEPILGNKNIRNARLLDLKINRSFAHKRSAHTDRIKIHSKFSRKNPAETEEVLDYSLHASILIPWIKSKLTQKDLKRLNNAATRLQAWIRSHQVSSLFNQIREAAIFIQCSFRAYLKSKQINSS